MLSWDKITYLLSLLPGGAQGNLATRCSSPLHSSTLTHSTTRRTGWGGGTRCSAGSTLRGTPTPTHTRVPFWHSKAHGHVSGLLFPNSRDFPWCCVCVCTKHAARPLICSSAQLLSLTNLDRCWQPRVPAGDSWQAEKQHNSIRICFLLNRISVLCSVVCPLECSLSKRSCLGFFTAAKMHVCSKKTHNNPTVEHTSCKIPNV